jgi:hypothetical protein
MLDASTLKGYGIYADEKTSDVSLMGRLFAC